MSVTIKDIAKECNVSITTVSRVINNKDEGVGERTREFILDTIARLDYRPNALARSMITKRTNTIGLVIPDVRNPFFSELARGAEDVCNENGYGIFLCNTDGSMEKEGEYIRILKDRFTDGILFTTQNTIEYNQTFKLFLKKHFPFLFIERYVDELKEVPGVFVDNFQGAYKLTQFIINKNHHKILFISGPLTTKNAQHRRNGHLKALNDNGIEAAERFILHGNYRYSGGYKAVKQYIASHGVDFTALFASNDLMAFGAYEALEEEGLSIPEDVSLAGFDNTPFPQVFRPKITTVEIPAYKMGQTAATMLLEIIQKSEPDEKKKVFTLDLIDKGSVIHRQG